MPGFFLPYDSTCWLTLLKSWLFRDVGISADVSSPPKEARFIDQRMLFLPLDEAIVSVERYLSFHRIRVGRAGGNALGPAK